MVETTAEIRRLAARLVDARMRRDACEARNQPIDPDEARKAAADLAEAQVLEQQAYLALRTAQDEFLGI